VLGNHLPRQRGIATFTTDLDGALSDGGVDGFVPRGWLMIYTGCGILPQGASTGWGWRCSRSTVGWLDAHGSA
jgi:hypothetical protein